MYLNPSIEYATRGGLYNSRSEINFNTRRLYYAVNNLNFILGEIL